MKTKNEEEDNRWGFEEEMCGWWLKRGFKENLCFPPFY